MRVLQPANLVTTAIKPYYYGNKSCTRTNGSTLFLLQSKTEANLRDQILWADAFILVYSVTDQCSFEEISRLKFLINYTKNAKLRDRSHVPEAESIRPVVFLVGNKQDIFGERMVLYEQGQRGSRETACSAFFELSVRESTDIPRKLFIDLYMEWVRTAQQRLLKPPIPGTFDLSVGGLLHSWNNRKSPSRPSSPNLPAGPSESDVSPRLKRRNSPRLLVRKLFSGLGQQCVVQPSACSESEQSKPVYLYLTEDSDSEELRSLEA